MGAGGRNGGGRWRGERPGDLGEGPAAADPILDDLAEGGGQGTAVGRGVEDSLGVAFEGEGLEQEDGKIVDVAGAVKLAFRALGGFADTVAAELDGIAHGKDVDGLD